MSRSITIFALLSAAFAFSDGALVSPEQMGNFELTPGEFDALKSLIPEDLNLTELSIAMRADHPHAHLSVVDVIKLYDYSVETHTVETSDGYILELHRISGSKRSPVAAGKHPILLQHGLICSSMDWVLAGPEKGFGFILADAGYDVWMGNVRGSKYSRKHKRYTVAQAKYWDFSWHEMGVRDLPRMIDHILETTRKEKLFYVGHSQGSTAFFVMASELPEYNKKINAMFSLAPVAYSSRMFSPVFQALSRLIKPINLVSGLIGVYEFKPTESFFKKFTSLVCSDNSILQPICTNALFIVCGFNQEQLNTTLLPAIVAHVPAGAGVNQFVHYAQIIRSGHFRQYDYGFWGNMAKYHTIIPPSYNLKNVKAPISLHYSVNDWLSDPKDVQKLYDALPKPVGRFRVGNNKWNHLDYLWAKDVKTILYDKIMSLMERYKQ